MKKTSVLLIAITLSLFLVSAAHAADFTFYDAEGNAYEATFALDFSGKLLYTLAVTTPSSSQQLGALYFDPVFSIFKITVVKLFPADNSWTIEGTWVGDPSPAFGASITSSYATSIGLTPPASQ